MKSTPKTTLLEDIAEHLQCTYLTDLHELAHWQCRKLYRKLKTIQPEDYTLFCWNDTLDYLFRAPAQETESAAKDALLKLLQSKK